MFCPRCGNEVLEGTAYCGICGQKVDADPPSVPTETQAETVLLAPSPPPPPKMFCPICGGPILDENAACPGCGWKAEPPKASAPAPQPDYKSFKSRVSASLLSDQKIKRILLAFGALVLVIVLICAVALGSGGSKKVVGEWENTFGDTIEFYEDGTCDIDDYILSLVSGTMVNGADDLLYDVKPGGKIEISYTSGRSVREVKIEYKVKGDVLTLGNMTFERES